MHHAPILIDAISQYCNVWLRIQNRSKKTISAYGHDLRQFAELIGKYRPLSELTQSDIERWILELHQAKYEHTSIRRKLASLRSFVTCWNNNHKGIVDLSWRLRFETSSTRRLTRVLNGPDLSRLSQWLRYTPPDQLDFWSLRDRTIVQILLSTGIRVGELVGITLHSVAGDTLRVLGKGSRERLAFLVEPRGAHLLEIYVAQRSRRAVADDKLFLNRKGGPLTEDGVRSILRRVARKIEISQHITPHMLRHTAATKFLEHGADLRVVQVFLGHASLQSTERYTHVTNTYLRDALTKYHPLASNAESASSRSISQSASVPRSSP